MLYSRLSTISPLQTYSEEEDHFLDGERAHTPDADVSEYHHEASSFVLTPVFSSFSETSDIVAAYLLRIVWEEYFKYLLPEGRNGIDVVLDDSCGTVVTFRLDGPDADEVGYEDLHDPSYNNLGMGWAYLDSFREMIPADEYDPSLAAEGECVYILHVYPTDAFKDDYTTDNPLRYAFAVSLIFVFTALVFLVYDWTVARRQNKVLRTATRTQAIVASLFPENVQERILQEAEGNKDQQTPRFRTNRTKDQLQNFLNDADDGPMEGGNLSLKSRPIADLFPEATVIFAE
jgi:hypothetical protein